MPMSEKKLLMKIQCISEKTNSIQQKAIYTHSLPENGAPVARVPVKKIMMNESAYLKLVPHIRMIRFN